MVNGRRTNTSVLPLEVEVDHYTGVPEDNRLCVVRDLSLNGDFFFFYVLVPFVNNIFALFAKIGSKIFQKRKLQSYSKGRNFQCCCPLLLFHRLC